MPVYQMLEEMPYSEFVGWTLFYEKRPKGWQDKYNTFLLMQAWGGGKNTKPWDIFPELERVFKNENSATASLKGSALFNFIRSAKGGDSIDVIDNQS